MTFRDDHYRSLCDRPEQYDDVIDLIMDLNPYAKKTGGKYHSCPEEFACMVVHECISSVIFGDAGAWSSTGSAIAIRVSSNPNLPGYKKVVLAYCGEYPDDIQETVRAIANGTAEVKVKETA